MRFSNEVLTVSCIIYHQYSATALDQLYLGAQNKMMKDNLSIRISISISIRLWRDKLEDIRENIEERRKDAVNLP